MAHRDDEGTPLGIDVLGGHVSSTWRQVREATSLDGYTPARPRHSYASGLVASGYDVVTLQRAVRHSSATITLGVCSHLSPTAEDRTRAAAGDLMAAALGARADSLRTETL